MKKSITLFSVALIISLGLFISPAFAATNGITRDQAVAWMNEQANNGHQAVGDGNDSVGLVKAYYFYLGQGNVALGEAKDYINNVPKGWKKLPAGSLPEAGDVAVETQNNHVYLIMAANATYHTGLHQDWVDGSTHYYYPTIHSNQPNSGFSALIRPDFSSQSTDTKPPVISNIKTSNISSNGFDISCEVADDTEVAHVYFLTWTSLNGQDDLLDPWPEGSKSGNTWTYHVNVGEHNNEAGNYVFCIYADDLAGNRGFENGGTVTVPGNSTSNPNGEGRPIGGGDRVVSDGNYHIISAISAKKGLDVSNTQASDGTNVYLWDNKEDPGQAFTIKWLGDGYYSIIHTSSGKSLDVESSKSKYGTNVQLRDYTGTDNQKWVIKPSSNNQYLVILSKCNGLCLDVTNSKNTNGTNIQMWGERGDNAQNWKFVASGEATGQTVSDGEYRITNALDNNKCLDVKSSNSNVQLGEWVNGRNQKWDVKYLGNGYYSILNSSSGKALQLQGNSQLSGTNIQVNSYSDANAQKWIINSAGDGYYNLIAKGSGLYADIDSTTSSSTPNVAAYVGDQSSNQRWQLINANPQTTKYTVTISASPSEGGTVSGAGSYDSGQSVTINANPNSGYTFDGWYNGNSRVTPNANYQFYINANTTLQARFSKSTNSTPDTPDNQQNTEDTVEIYRLCNDITGEHLYTVSQEEVNALVQAGWKSEGVAWKAPKTGQRVYRVFSPAIGDHLYTMDENETNILTSQQGWTMDFAGEPIFYSGGTIPIYRLYNPTNARHLLTIDENEYNVLSNQGWKAEGVALNALTK